MRVTDVTPQQRSDHRINIFLDGKYWVSLDIVQLVELGVKVGTEIDKPTKKRIEEESDFGKAYAAALNLLSIRLRSTREINEYGRRKKWDPLMTSRVIERLQQKGYLDDAHFAARWADSRQHLKPMSKRRVALELKQKGVSHEEVQSALEQYDDTAALKRVFRKKQNKYTDPQKMTEYLLRQGFEYSAIKELLSGGQE